MAQAPSGSGSFTLPIPNLPSYVGTGFYLQAVAVDRFLQVVLSNQILATMGH